MSRRQSLAIGSITVAVAVALAFLARPVQARPPAPECWWEGSTLHAILLPDLWSVTSSPLPVGTTQTADTFTMTFATTFTAYFWTRGGPYEALFKPGKQLNDYKPVCMAVP